MINTTEEWMTKLSWLDSKDYPQWEKRGPYVTREIAIHAAKTWASDLRSVLDDSMTRLEVVFVKTVTTETVHETIVPEPIPTTGDDDE